MNDITVTKNDTAGRWDVAYTADQAATVEKTLDTAGTLLDRDIKVSVTVPAGTEGTPTTAKGRVSNHSVQVLSSVTNTAGYISGGTHTDVSGVFVSASELVSGTKTIDAAGTTDVTNYAAVSVPEGVEGTPTNVVSPVNNHSVIVSPRVTNTEGYIPGTQKVGNNTTIYASDLVSGTKTITGSGTTDVTNYAEASVAAGSASTPATSVTANPSISVSSGGLITASVSASQSVTPSVSAGWVSSGTAGTVSVIGSNTQRLSTQAAQTITPGTTDQTIAAGKYLTGAQTILGDANLVAANIAKDVSIFGVTGTHEGGGGGSSWTLLYEWEVTVNTTSTSAVTVATYQNLTFPRDKNYLYYAVVKDKAGIRSGYFYSNVAVMFDLQKQNGQDDRSALDPSSLSCFYSTNGTSLVSASGNTGYNGVYVSHASAASAFDSGTRFIIKAKYSSSYSKTINGTYVVQVYQITLPSGATPFPT